ncbi:MAG: nucleotidyltransferase domain-containing protein [Candidatus Altiarchaeota archaeon]|nr:nucleotidyltransferase domain-containing protein [Candidatus Altiarchaeota archaeon]
MVGRKVIPGSREIEEDYAAFKGEVLGILLYGSALEGRAHKGSDIDICLVAGKNNADNVFDKLIATNLTAKYDVKIFELLPLKVKGSILENHKVIWSPDEAELSYYLHKWRRMWEDQKTSLKKLGLKMFT